MHLHGSTLYLGGQFDTIGGAARPDLGQVNLSGGVATSWQSPGVQGGDVNSVTVIGSVLYVGGTFLYANGQPVNGLAGFNADTGGLSWTSPLSGGYVEDLAGASGALLLGGDFGTADDAITGPFASLPVSGNPDAVANITPPTISISSPSSGQHVSVGASVTPAYTCSDSGSAVVACSGPAALDTATAGTKSYTVTASDAAGNQARRSVTYTVDGPDTPGTGGGSTTPTPPGPDPSLTPTPHPVVPPERNITPPRVLPAISLPATVRLSALKHGLVLKLSKLKSGSKYTAKLTLRGKLLASTKGKATAAGGATVRLHFSKAALRKLKRKASVRVQVLVVGADGNPTTVRRTLRVS
jgi:hypothetical protein